MPFTYTFFVSAFMVECEIKPELVPFAEAGENLAYILVDETNPSDCISSSESLNRILSLLISKLIGADIIIFCDKFEPDTKYSADAELLPDIIVPKWDNEETDTSIIVPGEVVP
jgi:hypothetical protein